MKRGLVIALEGLRFLWALRGQFRKPRSLYAYLHWRLGTLYGSFDPATGQPRKLRSLLLDLVEDWEHVEDFLLWRRKMRLNADQSRRP